MRDPAIGEAVVEERPLGLCLPLATPTLTDAQAAQLERVFKALADRHRIRILNLLANARQPRCVRDLVNLLGLKQPAVSYHLKQLADAGLVTRQRHGTRADYQLAAGALDQMRHPTRTPDHAPTSGIASSG